FSYFTAAPATALSSLSLHDALPISRRLLRGRLHRGGRRLRIPSGAERPAERPCQVHVLLQRPDHGPGGSGEHPERVHSEEPDRVDRKSTRLNSSHGSISYAVFCLKK